MGEMTETVGACGLRGACLGFFRTSPNKLPSDLYPCSKDRVPLDFSADTPIDSYSRILPKIVL